MREYDGSLAGRWYTSIIGFSRCTQHTSILVEGLAVKQSNLDGKSNNNRSWEHSPVFFFYTHTHTHIHKHTHNTQIESCYLLDWFLFLVYEVQCSLPFVFALEKKKRLQQFLGHHEVLVKLFYELDFCVYTFCGKKIKRPSKKKKKKKKTVLLFMVFVLGSVGVIFI